ncbi:YdaU family protein [Dokdonella sp. MW10]|uniref:YdaU family protein n=1 Tax=Dokdonella sp. MW10 TaxID=2992926 RepID=UPI003F7FB06D
MNYYERHLGDYARDTAHLSILEHGVYTLLLDRYYATEAPIPADQAHRLCRARSPDEREAVDAVLAEFFVLGDDGWHSARCDDEIAKFRDAAPANAARRENARDRQRRARERRAELFTELRRHGEVPAYDTPTAELVTLLSRVTGRDVTQPVTGDVTAIHTPDPIPQGERDTRATALAIALRQRGVMVSGTSIPVLEAAEAGVTPEEVIEQSKAHPGKHATYWLKAAITEHAQRVAFEAAPTPLARAGPAAAPVSRTAQAIANLDRVTTDAAGNPIFTAPELADGRDRRRPETPALPRA